MDRIPLWIDLRAVPADRRAPYLWAARDIASEAILVSSEAPEEGGDIILIDGDRLTRAGQPIGRIMPMRDGADQAAAAKEPGIVIIDADDWTIIPLENLIAERRDRPGTLFGLAHDPTQAGVFRDTLERGVHGVVLAPAHAADIEQAHAVLVAKGLPADDRAASGPVSLEPATITAIQDAGPGDRICVDATSTFAAGEGLLVGSTARSFALVHAETIETEFVRARPFRVNAGAVHSYLLGPDGRTQYLSEVAAGQRILAVSQDGTRTMTVGRSKLEHRPHLLVQWQGTGGSGNAVLQNAETIRLVRPDGKPVSVTALKVGDDILVHHEQAARHFGMPVDEKLEER